MPDGDELASVPMFAVLPRRLRDDLAAGHPVRRVAPGSVLGRHGEPALSLFVVQAGSVSGVVSHRDGSRTRFPAEVGPCVLDKAAVIRHGEHSATWTTASTCRVRTLPASTFHRLLREVPGLRDHVLGRLSEQVQAARRALTDRDATSAETKVARWLLARPSPARLPAGQQGLAEEIGLSRVTVNRALRRLAGAGVVATAAAGVTVLDPERLARAAE